jgi:hypothetical protein
MARINSFVPSSQNVGRHPTVVDCEFAVIGEGSDRSLHLSTFGSEVRVSAAKSSQSLQPGMEQAQQLVEIIERTFPEIRRK